MLSVRRCLNFAPAPFAPTRLSGITPCSCGLWQVAQVTCAVIAVVGEGQEDNGYVVALSHSAAARAVAVGGVDERSAPSCLGDNLSLGYQPDGFYCSSPATRSERMHYGCGQPLTPNVPEMAQTLDSVFLLGYLINLTIRS